MGRTRVRWQNVGRVAGGIAVGAVALFAAADLVEAPPPEPLPEDVGLRASGATGGYTAVEPAPQPRARGEQPARARRTQPMAKPRRTRAASASAELERRRLARPKQSGREGDTERATLDPATPPAAGAEVPAAPPAPPQPIAPPPAPPAPEPDSAPVPGDVNAEFGFEPRG